MGVRVGRQRGGANVFEADLSKGPAGQREVKAYTGGGKRR